MMANEQKTYAQHVLRTARLIQALGDLLPWTQLASALARAVQDRSSPWGAPKRDDFSQRELEFAEAIAGCSKDDAMQVLAEAADENMADARAFLDETRRVRERATVARAASGREARLFERSAELDKEIAELEGWLDKPLSDDARRHFGKAR